MTTLPMRYARHALLVCAAWSVASACATAAPRPDAARPDPEAPVLTVPRFAVDDSRVGTAGFVGETTRLSRSDGPTTYTLMAFAVGDVLTLGAMVEGPFDGTAEWRVGSRTFSVPIRRENRGSAEVTVVGPSLAGRHGGFRDFDWVNVDVPLTEWLPDGTAVRLAFRSEGRTVVLPEGGGAYASRLTAR